MTDLLVEAKDVDSWHAILGWVEVFRKTVSAKGPDSVPVWYRGVPKSAYRLTPSLFRFEHGADHEQKLFNLYTSYLPREVAQKNTDWDTLFDMQHYGVPTRLLDWTESLGVALFFALQGGHDDEPCLYLLAPAQLNILSVSSGAGAIPFLPDRADTYDYRRTYWENAERHSLPRAITPRFPNPRMQRQQGHFTIHGKSSRPLEELCPGCVGKLQLVNCPTITREILDHTNLNAFSLFPDFEGLAKYIVVTAGLAPPSEEWQAAREVTQALRHILDQDASTLLQSSQRV